MLPHWPREHFLNDAIEHRRDRAEPVTTLELACRAALGDERERRTMLGDLEHLTTAPRPRARRSRSGSQAADRAVVDYERADLLGVIARHRVAIGVAHELLAIDLNRLDARGLGHGSGSGSRRVRSSAHTSPTVRCAIVGCGRLCAISSTMYQDSGSETHPCTLPRRPIAPMSSAWPLRSRASRSN